jgi:hypothetical protein
MKKIFLISSVIFLLCGTIQSQLKVGDGMIKMNNPSITDSFRGQAPVQIASWLTAIQAGDKWMMFQVGTTNPRIAGSGDQVVFYNGGTSTFNDIQIRNLYQYSDRKAKTNVIPVFNAMDKVQNLNPVTFDWKNKVEKSTNSNLNKHEIGFIAQDVEQILPDAVIEDDDGNKLVNYSAIIPVLTEAIKELNSRVDELEQQITDLKSTNGTSKSSASSTLTSTSNIELTSKAKLYQSNPNPSSGATIIAYYIPKIDISANICIFDLQGNLIQKEMVSSEGNSKITIPAGKLKPAMYLYSLIVDEKLIDTKRMILTN